MSVVGAGLSSHCLDISEPPLSWGGSSLFLRTHYGGKLTPLCLPLRLSATGPSFVWVERFPCSFVHTTKEKPTPFASPSCDLTTGLSLFWEERWSCSFVSITLEKQTDNTKSTIVCLWGLLCGRNSLCLDISEPSLSWRGRALCFFVHTTKESSPPLCLPLRLSATGPSMSLQESFSFLAGRTCS